MPLRLDASVKSPQKWGRNGVVKGIDAETEIGHCHVPGCPKYDSKLVLRGDVKKTKKRLEEEPTRPKIKIKFTATDEFGQSVAHDPPPVAQY